MPFKPLSCIYGKFVIPQRIVCAIMCFFAIVCAYDQRMSLNLLITTMVYKAPIIIKPGDDDYCPKTVRNITRKIEGDVRYWSASDQGIIKLTFFIGYVVFHIPGGWLADNYGGRLTMMLSMIVTTIVNALNPLCVYIGDWPLLSAARLIMGLSQAMLYPAVSALLASWVPKEERSFLGAIAYAGSHAGTIMAQTISGFLVESLNSWPVVFYFWSAITVIWFVFFFFTVFSYPSTHPFVTDEEKQFLAQKITMRKKRSVPWLKILLDHHIWAIILGQIAHAWMFFTLAIDLPNYMFNVLGFDIKANGLLSSLPFFGLWMSSLVSGKVADIFIKRGMRIITMRRICTIIGNMVASAVLLIAPYVGCNKVLVITVFTLSMVLKGPFYCGLRINHLDLTTHFAGIATALVNGLGSISGTLTPYVIAKVAADNTIAQWRWVFWINFIISCSLTLIYVIFTSGDRASWDIAQDEPAEENK